MMLKKLLIFMLSLVQILVLTLSFGGCTNNTGVIKIKVLENDTAIKTGYLKELLTAFNAAYADKNYVAVDASMGEEVDLEQDGPYGYGPDVIYQANDQIMKYVSGKHIMPLNVTELEYFEEIPKEAWDAYKTELDGKTYYLGVPVNVQAPIMYYRKDLLPQDWNTDTTYDKNKNDVPDMLETWNEMYRFSKERNEENATKYGYMKSLFDVYFASGFIFSYGGYVFGDNNTNPKDIGFSKGNAEKGASVIRQQASLMEADAADDSITRNAYAKLAAGTYFSTMTTPDVYQLFYDEMKLRYRADDKTLTDAQLNAKVKENLVMASIPKLPASGDLTEENPELISTKTMGGVNGYAVSSYATNREASWEFVKFATSYNMVKRRSEMLSIVPAREDISSEIGGLSKEIYDKLVGGDIVVMPSIKEVANVWKPAESFFSSVAKDPFRAKKDQLFTTLDSLKKGLQKVDKDIYDSIYTLG